MAAFSNPYIGSGWTPAPTSNSVLGSPLFNTGAQLPQTNALLGWAGSNINQAAPQAVSGPFTAPTITGPPTGVWGNPGNLENPGSNLKDAMRNAGYLNVMQGQLRNQLIPMFANEMFALATPAANFYDTLMSDNNSPFYQAKQSEAFNQGVLQNQNAAAQAQQQLAERGECGDDRGDEPGGGAEPGGTVLTESVQQRAVTAGGRTRAGWTGRPVQSLTAVREHRNHRIDPGTECHGPDFRAAPGRRQFVGRYWC